MNKHDFSQSNVGAISTSILSCRDVVTNYVLPTEAMPYSWDTGVVNTVVTWLEVLQVNSAKDQLERLMQKSDEKLERVSQRIGIADFKAYQGMQDGEMTLSSLKEKFLTLAQSSKQSVSHVGAFDALHSSILKADEEFSKGDIGVVQDKVKKENIAEANEPGKQSTDRSKMNITDQNIKVDVTKSNNNIPTGARENKILNQKYKININSNTTSISAIQYITINVACFMEFINEKFTEKICDAITSGECEIRNDKIEISNTGRTRLYIEVENALNVSNEIQDLKKALTSVSVDNVISKGTLKVEKDGSLKYSYSKKVNNISKVYISLSFNPQTGVTKISYKLKYEDSAKKSEHSISLNYECAQEMVPVSDLYEKVTIADPSYSTNKSIWAKANDLCDEIRYNIDKSADELTDMIINLISEAYGVTRETILSFPDLVSDLNDAISAKDFQQISYCIVAIIIAILMVAGTTAAAAI